MDALIENFAASAPPLIEYVSVGAGRSASVAVTVVTAVVFSATLIDALAPAPLLVMTGALSSTGVTVTAIAWVSVSVPSLACTITNQELVVELLGDAGVTVAVASNGLQALELLERERFDGILMDCQMPELDGYDAARRIRQVPQWKSLPIIAMTASTMAGDREKALAAGMNDHIAKPIDVQAMFDTVARWVRPVIAVSAAPAAPPKPAGSASLDALHGIDAAIGRANTGGSDKLYRRLLVMFREGQGHFVAQFLAARDRGDDSGALRVAHNLRSVSASLGATGVQRAAQALEDACTSKADGPTIDRLLDDVDTSLRPVIEGLQAIG